MEQEAVVLLFDVAVFRWANQASAKLDENRMPVTEKVSGFLIAAIAVQLGAGRPGLGQGDRSGPTLRDRAATSRRVIGRRPGRAPSGSRRMG